MDRYKNRQVAKYRLLRTLLKRQITYIDFDWFDVTEWPTYILEIWNNGLDNWGYADRLKIVLFFHGNGCHWDDLKNHILQHGIYSLKNNTKFGYFKPFNDVIQKRIEKLKHVWIYVQSETQIKPHVYYYYNINLKHQIYYNKIYKKNKYGD